MVEIRAGIKEDAIFMVLLSEIASPPCKEVSCGWHALLVKKVETNYLKNKYMATGDKTRKSGGSAWAWGLFFIYHGVPHMAKFIRLTRNKKKN